MCIIVCLREHPYGYIFPPRISLLYQHTSEHMNEADVPHHKNTVT